MSIDGTVIDSSKLVIKSNNFTYNSAGVNNALYIGGAARVQVYNCTFYQNYVLNN